MRLFRTLAARVAALQDTALLRPGLPLRGLSAGVSSAHVEGWGAELERVAAELHAFMASSSLSYWMDAPPLPMPSDPHPEVDSGVRLADSAGL